MKKEQNILSFSHTDFTSLMQKRISRILLLCSRYDSFILEEDGRIDDQVFKEYTSLHFSFPPVFLKAQSIEEALDILKKEKIDLIITMLHGEENDPFAIAQQIKKESKGIPVVVLTPFSRRITRMVHQDIPDVDYVFSWLGNADLLLAIIKVVEDEMNAAKDMQVGAQVILLVDDSIRYISQVLPSLYKILFKQAQDAARQEGLNEHQTTLRKRARPKILLALDNQEAASLYKKYKDNLIGIISDVNLSQEEKDREGLHFCEKVRKDNATLPIIIQSSDSGYAEIARKLEAGFVNKNSKHLLSDIENNIFFSFGFGDFVFRKPGQTSYMYVAHASDLHDFQHLIRSIPDESFIYHASRNDFSRWFNTRGLFSIARLFRKYSVNDFDTVSEMKNFVFEAISAYKRSVSSSTIAQFNPSHIDENVRFYRLGEGSIGGKARGIAFLNNAVNSSDLRNKYPQFEVIIPKTLFVGSDYFDEFLKNNQLLDFALNAINDEEVLTRFVNAHLPPNLLWNLRSYLTSVSRPLAIRSSSKLEDSYYQPFAGIYSTYMIPYTSHQEKFLSDVADAIKAVYASVFMTESKAYIKATSNVIDEEKMAIVIQEVCGNAYGDLHYPLISGVLRSINYYPIHPEKSQDGVANIAVGLGKYVVENHPALRFCPAYPDKIMQHSSVDLMLKDSQKNFYALKLDNSPFSADVDGKANLTWLKVQDLSSNILSLIASTYDMESHLITENSFAAGKKVITFSKILRNRDLAFGSLLQDILKIGRDGLNSHVEIEFAVEANPAIPGKYNFCLLQIRPVGSTYSMQEVLAEESDDNCILKSSMALGNGNFENISDILYVKRSGLDRSLLKEITPEIEKMNESFKNQNKNYVLIGPGRWGSSDPWLGVPVKWSQISEAAVIVETGMEKDHIEPSQGTHFFQNITTFQVGYMVVNPYFKEGVLDTDYLDSCKVVYEGEYIRHVRFDRPLKISIDGRKNMGIICKP